MYVFICSGILGEMSKPMSWGMPSDKICEKLKKKDKQVNTIITKSHTYPQPLTPTSPQILTPATTNSSSQTHSLPPTVTQPTTVKSSTQTKTFVHKWKPYFKISIT